MNASTIHAAFTFGTEGRTTRLEKLLAITELKNSSESSTY